MKEDGGAKRGQVMTRPRSAGAESTPKTTVWWPEKRLKLNRKDNNNRIGRWWHSDIKDVSYLYVFKFFDLIVDDGGLKR